MSHEQRRRLLYRGPCTERVSSVCAAHRLVSSSNTLPPEKQTTLLVYLHFYHLLCFSLLCNIYIVDVCQPLTDVNALISLRY